VPGDDRGEGRRKRMMMSRGFFAIYESDDERRWSRYAEQMSAEDWAACTLPDALLRNARARGELPDALYQRISAATRPLIPTATGDEWAVENRQVENRQADVQRCAIIRALIPPVG
jgi:hypothetical protein